MEIIIRSRENGWETVRRMELPEDAGLVKSVLRSVKRRMDPPKLAGGVTEKPMEEKTTAAAPQEPPARAEETTPGERTTFETGYRGFMILTCKECGKSYTINAREPVTETTCKACGHVTELDRMAAVDMQCPSCGKTWRYKTNSEQADVSAHCVSCGELMISEWDRKLRRYVPQKLKREEE